MSVAFTLSQLKATMTKFMKQKLGLTQLVSYFSDALLLYSASSLFLDEVVLNHLILMIDYQVRNWAVEILKKYLISISKKYTGNIDIFRCEIFVMKLRFLFTEKTSNKIYVLRYFYCLIKTLERSTSILALIKFKYDDYIATKKQLFIEKSGKNRSFRYCDILKSQNRNIDTEKILVFIDISQQPVRNYQWRYVKITFTAVNIFP